MSGEKDLPIIDEIKQSLSKDQVAIVCPCGLGDTFLVCAFMKEFHRETGKTPMLVIKASHKDIVELFEGGSLATMVVTGEQMESLTKAFMKDQEFHSDIIYGHIARIWDDYLYRHIYPSELQYQEDESIITKMYRTSILKLPEYSALSLPDNIPKIDRKFYTDKYGIEPGKSIVIFPEANSINEMPISFWNYTANILRSAGYRVFFNVTKNREAYQGVIVDVPLKDIIAFVDLCGRAISLRSGISDILSCCNASLTILYPDCILFSTDDWYLAKMGLSSTAEEIKLDFDYNNLFGVTGEPYPLDEQPLAVLYDNMRQYGLKGVTKIYLKFAMARITEKFK